MSFLPLIAFKCHIYIFVVYLQYFSGIFVTFWRYLYKQALLFSIKQALTSFATYTKYLCSIFLVFICYSSSIFYSYAISFVFLLTTNKQWPFLCIRSEVFLQYVSSILLLASKRALYLIEHSTRKGRKLMLSQAKHKLISLWYFLSIFHVFFWLFLVLNKVLPKHTSEMQLAIEGGMAITLWLKFCSGIHWILIIYQKVHTHACTDKGWSLWGAWRGEEPPSVRLNYEIYFHPRTVSQLWQWQGR